MPSVQTEIEIDAPPERVWEVLTGFAEYGEWNPFIRRAEGEVREGARLRVTIEVPGRRPMEFRPTVQRADPRRELRWRGRLLVPGLFDGEHHFQLRRRDEGGTRLLHGEHFAGLLVRFMPASFWRATRIGFDSMNEALRTRAEAGG